jgi:hypothetical protein
MPSQIDMYESLGNRRMELSKSFIEKRQKSYGNIITEKLIHHRINRSIQVEGAFGVLKSDYGFNRFLARGKNNVKPSLFIYVWGITLINSILKFRKNGLDSIYIR